ncbi:hypothetical protein ARZXY2_4500 (plasmid) [Arthrobacter sp. ZXY-2]|nr:hypothetical protein ARZXY2_4500 [Arthrobacter sp. ZXY-2]
MTCSGVCLRAMIRELPPVSILGHETHTNTGLLSGDPTNWQRHGPSAPTKPGAFPADHGRQWPSPHGHNHASRTQPTAAPGRT